MKIRESKNQLNTTPRLITSGLWSIIIALALLAAGVPGLFGDTVTGTTGEGATFENRQPTLTIRYIIALQGSYPSPGSGVPSSQDRSQPYIGEIRPIAFDFAPSGWAFCEGQLLPIGNGLLFSILGAAFGGNGRTNFALPDLRGRVPVGAGQGPGLPNYVFGQQSGTAQLALSEANLPAHTHTEPGGNTAGAGSGTAVDNFQPSLGLNFFIANDGEIMIGAWNYEINGWAICNGRTLSINFNTVLLPRAAPPTAAMAKPIFPSQTCADGRP